MQSIHLLLLVPVVVALLALVLSLTSRRKLARRIAQAALWLSLAVVPAVFAFDLLLGGLGLDGEVASKASPVGRAISHALSAGGAILPSAFIASMALRRANAPMKR